MGSTQSASNIVDMHMESVINQVSRNIVSSNTTGGASNVLNMINGCTLENTKIDMDASYTASAESVAKAMTDQGMKNEISTAMAQVAENISQSLSANLTDADTENITNLVQDMTNNMTSENISECISNVFATNTVNCDASSANNVTLDFKATADFVGKCYQQVEGRQELEQAISNVIDQSASNVQEDTISAAITSVGDAISGIISSTTGPIVIIGVVVVVFLMKGGKFVAKGGPVGAMAVGGTAKMIPIILMILVAAYLFFECTQWNNWCNKNETE